MPWPTFTEWKKDLNQASKILVPVLVLLYLTVPSSDPLMATSTVMKDAQQGLGGGRLPCFEKNNSASNRHSRFDIVQDIPINRGSVLNDTMIKAAKRLVVAAHFQEDTSWLNELSQHFPVVVMGPGGLVANKGKEGMAYLTYIIQNYDNLPESMAFVHGHVKSYHTNGSQVERLLSIPCWESIPYTSITKFSYGKIYLDAGEKGSSLHEQERLTKSAWETNPNLQALLNMPTPALLETPCCGSFIVHKERILARERHVYEANWQWLVDTPMGNLYSSRVLEYTWHVLFGEPARIGPLDSGRLRRQCRKNNDTHIVQEGILRDPTVL